MSSGSPWNHSVIAVIVSLNLSNVEVTVSIGDVKLDLCAGICEGFFTAACAVEDIPVISVEDTTAKGIRAAFKRDFRILVSF